MYNNSIIDNKIKRTERTKREFDKVYDSIDGEIQYFSSGKYQIKSHKYGIIDFYTPNNTIIIRNQKKTLKNGLKWILKNLTR